MRISTNTYFQWLVTKAVAQRCPVKGAFLETSQNSQKNHLRQSLICNKVADLKTKNTFSYRIPPVTAFVFSSGFHMVLLQKVFL